MSRLSRLNSVSRLNRSRPGSRNLKRNLNWHWRTRLLLNWSWWSSGWRKTFWRRRSLLVAKIWSRSEWQRFLLNEGFWTSKSILRLVPGNETCSAWNRDVLTGNKPNNRTNSKDASRISKLASAPSLMSRKLLKSGGSSKTSCGRSNTTFRSRSRRTWLRGNSLIFDWALIWETRQLLCVDSDWLWLLFLVCWSWASPSMSASACASRASSVSSHSLEMLCPGSWNKMSGFAIYWTDIVMVSCFLEFSLIVWRRSNCWVNILIDVQTRDIKKFRNVVFIVVTKQQMNQSIRWKQTKEPRSVIKDWCSHGSSTAKQHKKTTRSSSPGWKHNIRVQRHKGCTRPSSEQQKETNHRKETTATWKNLWRIPNHTKWRRSTVRTSCGNPKVWNLEQFWQKWLLYAHKGKDDRASSIPRDSRQWICKWRAQTRT